jgi:hypothetical protein
MVMHLSKEMTAGERNALRAEIAEKYDWDRIAEQTIGVYQKALTRINRKYETQNSKKIRMTKIPMTKT